MRATCPCLFLSAGIHGSSSGDGFTEPQLISADSDLNQETKLWAMHWNTEREKGRETAGDNGDEKNERRRQYGERYGEKGER